MPQADTSPPTLVVGIGASAGGLKALKQLFAAMPGDTGLVFVVVVHLSPEHPSHLADLLQPDCAMPVIQVSETCLMEPDRVYVIPPGRNLSTIDTHLRLSELEERRRERAPIDHFFETLARTHRERAIGVILSGTGTDGTLGIKKIKEGAGLTIVQEPNEAEFDGMPQSAIATQLVDLILPIEAMPSYILRFARTEPHLAPAERADEVGEDDRQTLQQIFAQLRARTGQDFTQYKRSTVLRRLRRRMQLQEIERLDDYLKLLREHPTETRLLADDFLITVTQFFRDRDSFDYLEQHIIPRLFEDKTPADRLRVWSVGCATGEEAYSIAMLLLEQATTRQEAPEMQVFASDLHEHSLRQAREGLYPETIASDVSAERLNRFFTKEDTSYRIRKDVREIVVFANHNLLRDPPFSHMDMVVCRNVLIYLQRDPQNDVLDLFHYALNPDGLLVLGPSETVDRTGLFRVESKPHSVYRRRNVPRPEPRLPVFVPPIRHAGLPGAHAAYRPEAATSYGGLHQRIVERYAPPSVVVNEESQVVHVSEHAGRYLQVAGGDLSASVFKLVREELRLELRAALQAATETGKAARTEPVAIALDGEARRVVMQVRPSQAEDLEGFYLVLFDEMTEAEAQGGAEREPARGADATAELESARQQLRTVIEQYESAQEEMKASNEELQSTNEELRSAMEELETSKEELQSMNEELQTVNQENRHKVEELSHLTADLNNLIAATEIATIFLDQDLRILRVTPAVADLFNVRGSDRGRPLTDFTNRLGYEGLRQDAEQVLRRLIPVEREVESRDGEWYMMRVLPYRAGDRIRGVVITFFEITDRKRMELALRESEQSFRALVTASSQIVWKIDASGKVAEDSPSWRAFTGQTWQQLEGMGWIEAVHPQDRDRLRAAWRQALDERTKLDEELRLTHAGGDWRWARMQVIPLREEDGEVRRWIGMVSDITARKSVEEALKQADERKDRFLAFLAHELRNPLAPLRTAVDLMGQAVTEVPRLAPLREILDRQVRHLARLVDDLLDIARIKSGRIRLQTQRVDLCEVARHAAESLRSSVESRGHRLLVETPPGPLAVEGDAVRLEQIVSNLVDNAAKYTPPGGRIVVATRESDGQGELSVRDNGVGISAEALGRMFDVFYQAPPDAPDVGDGLGLGLNLVRQLTELHGGSVQARSDGPGQGSEFVVRIPLLVGAQEIASSEAPPAPAPAEPSSSVTPRRVLLVDDNRDAADALAMALQQQGHEVQKAYDGRSALAAAAELEPQVVLLDISLPDMSGHAVARALRERPETASALLVAISGHGTEQDRARSAAAGMDHHLVKPVALDSLLTLLEAGPTTDQR